MAISWFSVVMNSSIWRCISDILARMLRMISTPRNAVPAPLIIIITDRTPERFYPDVLAAAQPFEGVHILILNDRLTQFSPSPTEAAKLLAHVMAHEITHMLQSVDRHSASGIMRAHWTHEDYVAMQHGAPRFDPFDIELIRHA